jgi:hypothetical protein
MQLTQTPLCPRATLPIHSFSSHRKLGDPAQLAFSPFLFPKIAIPRNRSALANTSALRLSVLLAQIAWPTYTIDEN